MRIDAGAHLADRKKMVERNSSLQERDLGVQGPSRFSMSQWAPLIEVWGLSQGRGPPACSSLLSALGQSLVYISEGHVLVPAFSDLLLFSGVGIEPFWSSVLGIQGSPLERHL